MPSAVATAHLSSQYEVGDQPSIFDIVSHESLMTSLKPAVGHLTKFLAMMYPHRFKTAHKYYDELYLIFDWLLQGSYLRKYGASFSENFYGMKRVVQSTAKSPTEGSSRLRSLTILVLWPYVRDKLEKVYIEWQEKVQLLSNSNPKAKLMKLFVKVWPWIKSLLQALTVLLQLGYMINRSSVHSPFLWLAGVRLEKLTPADIAEFESLPAHLQPTNLLGRLWRFLLSIPGVFSRLFGYGLFLVQFLDFFYNSDAGVAMMKKNVSWVVPPAPHKTLRESTVVQTLDTNKCPLCMQRRRNDTALAVSGYVFCFQCIHTYLQQNNKCPVTGVPATTQQLIRLYIQK